MSCSVRSLTTDELNKLMSEDASAKRKAGILTALYNIHRNNRPFRVMMGHSEWGRLPMSNEKMTEFRRWLSVPRQINGKFNNWNNGFLGSIWCDTELFGKKVRVAMYLNNPDVSVLIDGDECACKFLIMWDYFD